MLVQKLWTVSHPYSMSPQRTPKTAWFCAPQGGRKLTERHNATVASQGEAAKKWKHVDGWMEGKEAKWHSRFDGELYSTSS